MLYSEGRQGDQRRFNLVKLEEWDMSFSKKRKNIIESRQTLFYKKKNQKKMEISKISWRVSWKRKKWQIPLFSENKR